MTGIHAKAASVRFEKVSKVYGRDVKAVDSIDLEVAAGTLVTLLGPSGCGKTTTLRMIAGLELVSAGRIFIGDKDVTKLPATDRDVSMVFQSYALFPHMTVLENVSYGLKFSGFGKEEARQKAQAGLGLVGLKGYDSRLPSELSGGQQQRLCIARAIATGPEVLLMDEPCSALDPIATAQVEELIDDLRSSFSVVIVTHSMQQAARVSQKTAFFHLGNLVEYGDTPAIFTNPKDPRTEAYITGRIG